MKKKVNILTFLLVFCMVFGYFAVLGTQSSYAASGGKKTIYVPIQVVTNYGRGYVCSCAIKYNKKGLPVSVSYNQSSPSYLGYDKKGHLKGYYTVYNGKRTYDETVKTNKKGLITKVASVDYNYKRVVQHKRRKDGTKKKSISKQGSYTGVSYYDKYGNVVSSTWTDGNRLMSRSTYSNTLDRKGNILRSDETTYNYSSYSCKVNVSTMVTNNVYDKHGNKIKETIYDGYQSNGIITTIQYKKIKVSKKHVKYVKEFSKGIASRIYLD